MTLEEFLDSELSLQDIFNQTYELVGQLCYDWPIWEIDYKDSNYLWNAYDLYPNYLQDNITGRVSLRQAIEFDVTEFVLDFYNTVQAIVEKYSRVCFHSNSNPYKSITTCQTVQTKDYGMYTWTYENGMIHFYLV
jgi:hypothetical protein